MGPLNLDELRKMAPGVERAKLITAYLKAGEEKLSEARSLRDEDFRAAAKKLGPSETARQVGVGLSTVKSSLPRRR